MKELDFSIKNLGHTPMQHITLSTDKLSAFQAGLFKSSRNVLSLVTSASSFY